MKNVTGELCYIGTYSTLIIAGKKLFYNLITQFRHELKIILESKLTSLMEFMAPSIPNQHSISFASHFYQILNRLDE